MDNKSQKLTLSAMRDNTRLLAECFERCSCEASSPLVREEFEKQAAACKEQIEQLNTILEGGE